MPTYRLLAAGLCAAALTHAAPAFAGDTARPDKVSFYFAAHQDDWQLFMNPSAFEDVIQNARKTVFIHMTAGDAGLGVGLGGRKHPFYLARDNGAETAIRFMADTDDIPAEKAASYMPFNGHQIYRIAYRNTATYFLRVPDGSPSGAGYPDTHFQSLMRLASGENDRLSTVDGTTVYRGWGDLVTTLKTILEFERGSSALAQINVAETDPRINPSDHSDHVMTAKAALDAAKDLACVRRVFYVDYASSRLPENLNAQQRDMESSVFAVTLSGVMAYDHRTSWRHYDKSFVGRNYFRAEEASGRCGGATEFAAARR